MSDIAKAIATQLANIAKQTGKSLAPWSAIVKQRELTSHGGPGAPVR